MRLWKVNPRYSRGWLYKTNKSKLTIWHISVNVKITWLKCAAKRNCSTNAKQIFSDLPPFNVFYLYLLLQCSLICSSCGSRVFVRYGLLSCLVSTPLVICAVQSSISAGEWDASRLLYSTVCFQASAGPQIAWSGGVYKCARVDVWNCLSALVNNKLIRFNLAAQPLDLSLYASFILWVFSYTFIHIF